jgi:sugar transferase (PEP-CTERM system associated)
MIRLFQQFVPRRKLLLIASECLLLSAVVFAGTCLPGLATRPLAWATPHQIWRGILSALTVSVLCQVSLSFNDLYDWRVSRNRRDLPNRLLHATGFGLITLAVIVFLQPRLFAFPCLPDLHSETWKLVLVLGVAFALLYWWRLAFHWFFYKWGFGEKVVVLGTGALAQSLCREMHERPETGFEIVGCFGSAPPNGESTEWQPPYLGTADGLPGFAIQERVSRVVVAVEQRRGELPVDQLLTCRLAGIRVEERESIYEKIHGRISLSSLRPSYLIFGAGFRKSPLEVAGKRLFDILLSVAGLLASAPLMLAVAVAIKLDSPGRVFFRQRRTGLHGREFTCLKFRSMRSDAEARTGPVWAVAHDDRITKVGRILRATRIDELPQMINVLLGQMSFVGPRPERQFFVDVISKEVPFYKERLTVRPGLTGWAQILYPYGASIEDARQKLEYDLYYIKNMSLVFDLTILLRTIKVVLLRRGAH